LVEGFVKLGHFLGERFNLFGLLFDDLP